MLPEANPCAERALTRGRFDPPHRARENSLFGLLSFGTICAEPILQRWLACDWRENGVRQRTRRDFHDGELRLEGEAEQRQRKKGRVSPFPPVTLSFFQSLTPPPTRVLSPPVRSGRPEWTGVGHTRVHGQTHCRLSSSSGMPSVLQPSVGHNMHNSHSRKILADLVCTVRVAGAGRSRGRSQAE